MSATSGSKSARLFSMVMLYGASSGSLILANAAQLVTFAVLARTFGPAEFGHYVSIIAVTSIAVHLCGLGATECLVRRVAQDPASYPNILGHNLVLSVISGIPLIVVGMLVMPVFLPVEVDPAGNLIATFLLLLTNILLVRLVMLAEAIYLGHSMYSAANRSVVGFALIRTLTAVLACKVFGVTTVHAWALWQCGCHVVILVIYAWFLKPLGRPRLTIIREEIRQGLLFATPFLFRAIRQNVDLLVLGMMTSVEIVASYGVARRITDSSYMAIDAMNRLVYPKLAVASQNGLHHALVLTKKLLVVACFIGFGAGLAIHIAAPYLPLLFGTDYVSLVAFTRIMGWYIVLIAIWSVAVDLLGAAGLHGRRALILNVGNGLGAIMMAIAAWVWPPEGVFIASYLIELFIVISAWAVLLRSARHTRRTEALREQRA